MKKILHVGSSYFPRIGGLPSWIRDVAHRTSDEFEHHMMCRNLIRSGVSTERVPAGTDNSDPDITVHRFESNGPIVTDEMLVFAMGFDYDLMLLCGVGGGLIQAAEVAHNRGIPVLLRGHAAYEHIDIHDVDKVIVIIESWKGHMVSEHGFSDDDVVYIPRLIDLETYGGDIRTGKNLIYVGRIAPEKRVPLLVDLLYTLDEDYTLRIVGDYDHESRDMPPLRDRIREYGLEDRVSIQPALTEEKLVEEYHKGDVFVSSSRRERFCFAFLEALANGMPVYTLAEGTCREWGEPYVYFYDSIADITESEIGYGLSPLASEQVRERFEQEFSWQANKGKFVSLLKGMMK